MSLSLDCRVHGRGAGWPHQQRPQMPCSVRCRSRKRCSMRPLESQRKTQKCSRLSQKLRRNGYSVDAIGGPTGLSWTLSSDGRSATSVNNVLTPSAGNGTHATPSAAIVGAARLVKLQGEQQSESWLLPLDRPALVGRSGKKSSSLDIDLWPDTAVSRRHALIWFDGKRWCIEDLRSANGTLLDDSDIRGQRAMHLAPGTTIRFGCTLLKLTALESEIGEQCPDQC